MKRLLRRCSSYYAAQANQYTEPILSTKYHTARSRSRERAHAFEAIYSLFFQKPESIRDLAKLFQRMPYADFSSPKRAEGGRMADSEVASGAYGADEGTAELPSLSHLPDDEDHIILPERSRAPEGFAWELVQGVWNRRDELDKTIREFSQNWRLERMGRVELSLLRLAVHELVFRDDVPPKVVINEAIELSKQFGDDSSRNFVNGILDAVVKAVESGKIQRSSWFWGEEQPGVQGS